MVKKIEFNVSDEIWNLIGKATLSDEEGYNEFARECFLQGLAAYFMRFDDDATADKVFEFLEHLEKL